MFGASALFFLLSSIAFVFGVQGDDSYSGIFATVACGIVSFVWFVFANQEVYNALKAIRQASRKPTEIPERFYHELGQALLNDPEYLEEEAALYPDIHRGFTQEHTTRPHPYIKQP